MEIKNIKNIKNKITFDINGIKKIIDLSNKKYPYKFIIGVNGSGKTTLLRELSNNLKNIKYYRISDIINYIYKDINSIAVVLNDCIPNLNKTPKNINLFIKKINEYFNDKTIESFEPLKIKIKSSKKLINFLELSDGEINLFLIWCYAIFSNYKIICFDDIECSLHITWQLNLIDSLIECTDKKYIIATHSPSIIDYNNDFNNFLEL